MATYGPLNISGRAIFWIKLSLSSILLTIVLLNIDAKEIARVLSSAKTLFIGIALSGMLLDRFLMAYRWNLLMSAHEIRIPIWRIVKIYFMSSFAGNFLPSSLAPDLVRIYFAARSNSKTNDLISSVLIDRLLGICSLCVIALLSIIYIYFWQSKANWKIIIMASAILITLLGVYSSDRIMKYIKSKTNRVTAVHRQRLIWKSVSGIYESFTAYKRQKSILLKIALLSFGNHTLSIFTIYYLSLSIDMHLSLFFFCLFVPLIVFIIMIPVSISGIGLQEGAFVYYFTEFNASPEHALTLALLFRVTTIISSLPGAALYAVDEKISDEILKVK